MLREILKMAITDGLTLKVYDASEDVVDYEGTNLQDAMDAIDGVDEISVDMHDDGDLIGSLYIVNDLDEDERIVDYTGAVHTYMENL